MAGGNLEYYSQADPKYKGHYVVLTFNPFNETWTVQPRMRHGRWYPTLTELGDGRVVITAGLDEEPLNVGNNNNLDVEVFTPSPNLDGVGSIGLLREDQGFGLYPHVFLNPRASWSSWAPTRRTAASSTRSPGPSRPTQTLPSYGAQGGRREWGSAVMLPSGPDGPSQILMVGGSDAEDDHYDNPDQTNSTLLVNMANGAITGGPPNIRKRSHVNTTILPDGTLFTNGGGAGSIGGDQYAGPVYHRRAPLPRGLELGRDPRPPRRSAPTTPPRCCSPTAGWRRWATTAPRTRRTARSGPSSTTTRRTSSRARGRASPRRPAAPPTACPWGSGRPTRSRRP